MVTDAILDVFEAGLTWLLGLLPAAGAWVFSIWEWAPNLAAINYMVPIGPVMAFVASVMALFPVMFSAKLGIWLLVGVLRGGASSA